MTKYYTDEKNAQIVLAVLKANGIKRVVASPGATNITMVTCFQNDPFFKVYSAVDERSAAYMACGLADETGEPVVISCTQATASRNYLPGLTEAYYRKLPILALTSSRSISQVGHLDAQVIDRSVLPKDVAKLSLTLPIVKDDEDIWECEMKVNQSILELKRHGGGPVHINIQTIYSSNFDIKELPEYRIIKRITPLDKFPELPIGNIAIFIGSHLMMSKSTMNKIDAFCRNRNALVFCDHTSNYKGQYRVLTALASSQLMTNKKFLRPDILIHLGEVSGDYFTQGIGAKEVWRVSPDGEIRDRFKKLTHVFEMPEQSFFDHYISDISNSVNSYFQEIKDYCSGLSSKVPDLPFSNIWVASQLAHRIPENSAIHFSILNSLRAWNFFELPSSVNASSNVGGFGIDGAVSTLLGASLANQDKLYFGVIGDLAFFYDMNALGNRHLGRNLRILLINNGKGTEFRQYNHRAAFLGEDADEFVAADGHFGNKSQVLVMHYAQSLGFEYISAANKSDFNEVYERFINPEIAEKPILFEVFTNSEEESDALEAIMHIETNVKGQAQKIVKQVLGKNTINLLKKATKK